MDGPGDTDNEADDPAPPPTRPSQLPKLTPGVTSTPSPLASPVVEDSAQIAKKIKDLIHLKGSAKSVVKEEVATPSPPQTPTTPKVVDLIKEESVQRSDSVDSLKRGANSVRSASPGSVSGNQLHFPIKNSSRFSLYIKTPQTNQTFSIS